MTFLLIATLVCSLVCIVMLALVLRKSGQREILQRFDSLGMAIDTGLRNTERSVREEFVVSRQESSRGFMEFRQEISFSTKNIADSLVQQGKHQYDQLEAMKKSSAEALKGVMDSTLRAQNGIAATQKSQLDSFAEKIEKLSESVGKKLGDIQESNAKKLEEMRVTVDEKLQSTLDKRLGESFKLVSERLELVQKGLGEMQALAVGVGDLKKVLSNVKARGTWGEIQLGSLLEEMLTADQYEKNVKVRPRSPEIVEFAIRLPGQEDMGKHVYLPIDSKFPKEDYERLQAAQDRGDPIAAEAAGAALELQIKKCARDIRDKYVHPPETTDFAILFLPIESLFAEVLRRPGLAETIQREHRVTIAGPTTLAALLNSLQMGFRTLAIQKRSSEVWKVLSTVKGEFGKFGDLLIKVGNQLQTAQNTIADATTKTRAIERRLKGVEELPASIGAVEVPLLGALEPISSTTTEPFEELI